METGVACTCKPCWPLSQAVARCWDVPINIPSSASLPPKAKREPGARQRRKETAIWHECVQALGPSTAESVRVHVGDRGADIFEFLHTCRSLHTHFVVRADQNRRVQTAETSIEHLFEQARGVPAQAQRPFDLPASHGRQARATTLQLSWMSLSLLPPRHDPRLNTLPPLPVWVVRVWEEDTPEGEEPLEWILLTSLEVTCCQDARASGGLVSGALGGRGVSPMPENGLSYPGASAAKRRALDPLVGDALSPCCAAVAAA